MRSSSPTGIYSEITLAHLLRSFLDRSIRADDLHIPAHQIFKLLHVNLLVSIISKKRDL